MLLRLFCPGCGHTSDVSEGRSAQEVLCPVCRRSRADQPTEHPSGTSFTITTLDWTTAAPTVPPKEPTEPRERKVRAESVRIVRLPNRKPNAFWWGLAVGVGAALVCGAGLAAVGWLPLGVPANWVGAAAAPTPPVAETPDGPSWADLSLAEAEVHGDFLRLAGGDHEVATNASYSGPIDVTLVARADRNNVRIHAYDTARIIFNWDAHPGELRVHRPDGLFGAESGSLATAPFAPTTADPWHTFRWRITAGGMTVWVDGQLAFTETRANDLSVSRPVRVSSSDAVVDVRSLTVQKLP